MELWTEIKDDLNEQNTIIDARDREPHISFDT
jgi:hypothetical protein